MARPFSKYRAIPEAVALDAANDVLALSQEGRARLVLLSQEAKRWVAIAYERHVMDDWPGFLDAVNRMDRVLTELRDVARQWADDVTESSEISRDQLPLRLVA